MATPKTETEKAALARAWLDERDRLGTTQAEFARRHGIGERTLRAYVSAHAPRSAPVQQLGAILAEAISAMQRLADRLDELDTEPAADPVRDVLKTEPITATAPAAAAHVPVGKEGSTATPNTTRHSFWE